MTAEEDYIAEIRQITKQYPPGNPNRGPAKSAAWHKFKAKVFERDGDRWLIARYQAEFASDYIALLQWRAEGHGNDTAYRVRRIQALRDYAKKLEKVELVSDVFDDTWVADFAEASLAEERSLLDWPDPPRPLTLAELGILCNPLRRFSWQFFEAVHRDFGVGRLASEPAIFDGVPELEEPVPALAKGEPVAIR